MSTEPTNSPASSVPPLTVWVDADACPGPIKEILVRAAQRKSVRTVFVANKFIALPDHPCLATIRVGSGADVTDAHIVEIAHRGDLVISHDIPLAAQLVENGVTVIDPRGELYSAENVRERLSIRNFMHDLREDGVRTSGPAAFGQRASQAFANTYDRELTRALRERVDHPRERRNA